MPSLLKIYPNIALKGLYYSNTTLLLLKNAFITQNLLYYSSNIALKGLYY